MKNKLRISLPKHTARMRSIAAERLDHYKARSAVSYAIKSGKLIRPDRCSNPECNKLCEPEAHHDSYLKKHWLDVIFLCKDCHVKADKNIKALTFMLRKKTIYIFFKK